MNWQVNIESVRCIVIVRIFFFIWSLPRSIKLIYDKPLFLVPLPEIVSTIEGFLAISTTLLNMNHFPLLQTQVKHLQYFRFYF